MTQPKILWTHEINGAGLPPAVGLDGTIYIAPRDDRHIYALNEKGRVLWRYCYNTKHNGSLCALWPRPQPIIAIGKDKEKVWKTQVIGNAVISLTLTPDGILYAVTAQALYAIQCPSGLADAPWPMDAQNPQRTSCANPKYSQPIKYGTASPPASAAVEIRTATPSRPVPEKPFTKEEVLQQLDTTPDFPMLDNGYVYPATVRLNAFRDAAGLRWALVIEVVGWNNHQSDHQAIENTLYCFGNWLNVPPGLTNEGFLHMTRDGDESATFDDQDVDAEARTLYAREKLVRIPRARKRYKELGIELEDPDTIKGYELLRALIVEHRALFLATEEELRQRVPSDLPLVLRLDQWRHPQVGSEKPSQTETFQMIAEVLATGDAKRYQPKTKPNTHWKHWPMGGQL